MRSAVTSVYGTIFMDVRVAAAGMVKLLGAFGPYGTMFMNVCVRCYNRCHGDTV
jgi:hypothetical protein